MLELRRCAPGVPGLLASGPKGDLSELVPEICEEFHRMATHL